MEKCLQNSEGKFILTEKCIPRQSANHEGNRIKTFSDMKSLNFTRKFIPPKWKINQKEKDQKQEMQLRKKAKRIHGIPVNRDKNVSFKWGIKGLVNPKWNKTQESRKDLFSKMQLIKY